MRVACFCHSLLSDWNHGNAHFLRGVASELMARGHDVRVFEPADAWSVTNLLADGGGAAIAGFRAAYPQLASVRYDPASPDLDRALDGVDLVLVHEWSDPGLVAAIGARRRHGSFRLFFHDTHHRAASAPAEMARYDLRDYDGVLAFGRVIRDRYLEHGWAARAWTWHEAADVRVFRPRPPASCRDDLVWIGNWGDGERTREVDEYLIQPARTLRLRARAYGVRYPPEGRAALAAAGIEYGGWLPNYGVPAVFARHRITVHIPRRFYAGELPGIPTIRPFEALACGIPLVSAPWDDVEGLFTPGRDFLVARSGREMTAHLRALLDDRELAEELAAHGLRTIRARHTCAHRVDELLAIYDAVARPQAEVQVT